MDVTALDGRGFAKFLAAGAYALRNSRSAVDDLNVFPVPDGDTGSNMYVTLRQGALEAARVRERGLDEVARAAARASLLAARGNSGVIASQMLRGFAAHVEGRSSIPALLLGPSVLAGVAAAKAGLASPADGTMLTVADAAGRAACELAKNQTGFHALCAGMASAAKGALEHTPEQLDVLKEAGVVDAGGAGILCLLSGIFRFRPEGEPWTPALLPPGMHSPLFSRQQTIGENCYCTEFVLEGAVCAPPELLGALREHGESLIVAGSVPTLKVHIHTANPELLEDLARRFGDVTRVKVDDMRRQHGARLPGAPAYSVVALATGPGFERIARALGAEETVAASDNLVAEDFERAFERCASRTVYLLVNCEQALSAAEQAGRRSDRAVRVVRTRDPIAGIAALLGLRSPNGQPPDPEALLREAARTRSARVFLAGKEPTAAVGGVLRSGASVAGAAKAAAADLGAGKGGLLAVYYGGGQGEADARAVCTQLREAFAKAEVECHYGGQTDAEYWISFDE